MSSVLEVNVITGERIERDFTAEEAAQRAKDEAAAQAEAQIAADREITDSAARELAIAHAKSLGFTDAMIAVMYPGLAG